MGQLLVMLSLREKFIAILSNDIIAPSDAIILLEGDGYNRVQKAVDLYKAAFAPVIVFSGGAVNYNYGSFPSKDIIPALIKLGVQPKDIIIEDRSMHTQAQAVEFLRLAKKNNWHRAILVASPDHQYRAYLTFLRQILNENIYFILFNSPAENLSWFNKTLWGKPYNRLEQEFEKIEKYSLMGHLASFEEAISYQQWKEQQLQTQN